ncbi:MAG: NAD(P)H-quinone oxidoreductase [Ferrovum sp.]|nr:NAD(P)H-quinone oxidoreductase [Ferrovum sp.]
MYESLGIVCQGVGGPEVMQWTSITVRDIGPYEVLVQVLAAGVNRLDCLQRLGRYPVPPDAPPGLGLEVAGVVLQCGVAVSSLRVGDRVMGLVAGGGYATHCIVDELLCFPWPDGWSAEQAATLPEALMTLCAHGFGAGRIQPGERVMVIGGAGGVGSCATQVLATLGYCVWTTAGGEKKVSWCQRLGAKRCINYQTELIWEVMLAETNGSGVDVILDFVGGRDLDRKLETLSTGGRLVIMGLMQGARAEMNQGILLQRQLTILGVTLRQQSLAKKERAADYLRQIILPLINQGRVQPLVDSVFPIQQVQLAHERMESGAHCGKIVLRVG